MGWINSEQQKRDHRGLREVCAADGHAATAQDPLGLSDTGSRIHRRHFTEPASGFFGKNQHQ